MFDAASAAKPAGTNDLSPYWVYPREGGATIERHVPVLPLSRDVERYARIKENTMLYRLVFGQPRQDDLLDYLKSRGFAELPAEELAKYRIDLTPIPNGRGRHPTKEA